MLLSALRVARAASLGDLRGGSFVAAVGRDLWNQL